nr:hypothetical protein [Pandoravirus massiliensis]
MYNQIRIHQSCCCSAQRCLAKKNKFHSLIVVVGCVPLGCFPCVVPPRRNDSGNGAIAHSALQIAHTRDGVSAPRHARPLCLSVCLCGVCFLCAFRVPIELTLFLFSPAHLALRAHRPDTFALCHCEKKYFSFYS